MAAIPEKDRVDFASALTPEILETGGLGTALARRGIRKPIQPIINGPILYGAGGPTTTFTNGAYGISANPTVTGGGSGHAVGDVLTIIPTTGTAIVPALVTVAAVSGGVITSVTIARTGVFTVSGTLNYTQQSTSGSGTGATFSSPANSASACSFSSSQTYNYNNTALRWNAVAPLLNIGSSGYYGSNAYQGEAAYVEFASDAVSLDLLLLDYNTRAYLYVDNKYVGEFVGTSTGHGNLINLTWPSAVPPETHTYRLYGVNLAFLCVKVASLASVWMPYSHGRPKVAWLGDSYTYGTVGGFPVTMAMLIGQAMNWDVLPLGTGGTSWESTGANLPVTRVTGGMLTRTQAPFDIVVWDMGYNEGAAPNTALLTSNLNAAVAAVNAIKSDTKHIFIGPATPIGTTAGLNTVRSTVMSAAAALNASFIDMAGVISAANKQIYTDPDNQHPKVAGYIYRAARALPQFAAL